MRYSFMIGLMLCSMTLFAQQQEADLKAVFIYNFTKYIEWDSLPSRGDFVIGIVGSSAVTSSLREIAKTSRIKNKRMVIRVFKKPEEADNCQILFVAAEATLPASEVVTNSRKGVLTISEESGYANKGVAMNFVIVNSKLKFEVNLSAIYGAGLKISAQLLKLAIVVDEEKVP